MLYGIGEKGGELDKHWTNVLCADAGGRTLTRSTMKVAYASSPSASQPITGNSLKNRVVATASRAFVASMNWRLKTSRRWFRASFRACAGGKGFSEEGYRPQRLSTRRTLAGKNRSYHGGLHKSAVDNNFRDGHGPSTVSRR
jgi:hypothetical protein